MLYKVTTRRNLNYTKFKLEMGMSVEVVSQKMSWNSQEWVNSVTNSFKDKYKENVPQEFMNNGYFDVVQLK